MPYAGCRYRVFIGKLCVIATLPSVIRKRRTGILINIISLGTGGYNQYDELNIIFFIRLRSLGCVMPYFRNKMVVLSRPNFDEDYNDYYFAQ